MKDDVLGSGVSRRSTLKTIGAVGALSLAGFTGTAAAKNQDKTYGNGNGIGAFLNEEAHLKETPIWTGGVADMRGMETVTVHNGVTTDIGPVELDLGDPFGVVTVTEAPVSFDPLVVQISPGATVEWVWSDDLLVLVPGEVQFPIPHNVVAVEKKDGSVPFDSGQPVYAPNTFSHTFEDGGNYLYYCTPHGAPFEVPDPDGNLVYNEFGMRGAVKVTGKPL